MYDVAAFSIEQDILDLLDLVHFDVSFPSWLADLN